MPSDEEGEWTPPRKTHQEMRLENHPRAKICSRARFQGQNVLQLHRDCRDINSEDPHSTLNTPSPGGFFNKQMGKKNTFSLAQLQLWQGLQAQMGLPG